MPDIRGVVAQLGLWAIHIVNPHSQTGDMSKPSVARYRTPTWSSYTASLRTCWSLRIWRDKKMTWRAPRDGSAGRPAVFFDAGLQFCLTAARKGIAQQRPERGSRVCSSCSCGRSSHANATGPNDHGDVAWTPQFRTSGRWILPAKATVKDLFCQNCSASSPMAKMSVR